MADKDPANQRFMHAPQVPLRRDVCEPILDKRICRSYDLHFTPPDLIFQHCFAVSYSFRQHSVGLDGGHFKNAITNVPLEFGA